MSHRDRPIQTIRLSARDQRKLVDGINAKANPGKVDNERRNVRIDFHCEGVIATITQPNGMSVRHAVVTRNLSRWGIAFVHGQFVYPDSICEMTVPTLNKEMYAVRGKVVRCRHVEGIVHEVSVIFDEPIELDLFSPLTDEQKERNTLERAEDMAKIGLDSSESALRQAMIVDDVRSDRKLFDLYLTEMGLKTIEAVGAAQAMNIVMRNPVDLILIDRHLADYKGADLIRRIRQEAIKSVIIGVSAVDGEQSQSEMIEAGANAFLAKPFDRVVLRQAVQGLLGLVKVEQTDDEPIFSKHAADAGMRPIIADFVAELGAYVSKLHKASAMENYDLLLAICHELKGGGGGYGFDSITETARQAIQTIDAERRDAEKIRRSVNELLGILRRVRFE